MALDDETKSKAEVLQIVSQYARYTGPFPPKQKSTGVQWPLASAKDESPPKTVERVVKSWQSQPGPTKHPKTSTPSPESRKTPNKSRSSHAKPIVNQ